MGCSRTPTAAALTTALLLTDLFRDTSNCLSSPTLHSSPIDDETSEGHSKQALIQLLKAQRGARANQLVLESFEELAELNGQGGTAVIRQAISCDICGAEKKQTNLWFVAYHQAGELRVSGWNSRNRLRAESKHLCGQTCLHRLVDEFFARTVANRSQTPDIEVAVCAEISPRTDTSLTSNIAHVSIESSERIVAPSIPALPQHSPVPQTAATQPALVALPTRLLPQDPRPASGSFLRFEGKSFYMAEAK